MNTPSYVLEALNRVRESGDTNMMDRGRVLELLNVDDDDEAYEWLYNQPNWVDILEDLALWVAENSE